MPHIGRETSRPYKFFSNFYYNIEKGVFAEWISRMKGEGIGDCGRTPQESCLAKKEGQERSRWDIMIFERGDDFTPSIGSSL